MDEEQRFLRYVISGSATLLPTALALLIARSPVLELLPRCCFHGAGFLGFLFAAFVGSGALGYLLAQVYFILPCSIPDYRSYLVDLTQPPEIPDREWKMALRAADSGTVRRCWCDFLRYCQQTCFWMLFGGLRDLLMSDCKCMKCWRRIRRDCKSRRMARLVTNYLWKARSTHEETRVHYKDGGKAEVRALDARQPVDYAIRLSAVRMASVGTTAVGLSLGTLLCIASAIYSGTQSAPGGQPWYILLGAAATVVTPLIAFYITHARLSHDHKRLVAWELKRSARKDSEHT